MSAHQVISVDFKQSGNDKEDDLKATSRSAIVVDRQNFEFWAKSKRRSLRNFRPTQSSDMSEVMRALTHRVWHLGESFERGNHNEIVTISARISIEALQMGLPKTSRLAADLGEAKMKGEEEKARERFEKLSSLVEAFCEDISLEV